MPWLGSGNLFVRRHDFDCIGGFREDLEAAEDVDLCFRLLELDGEIIQDTLVANTHHGEPATLSQFVRKEYWRGSSGLRAFIAHGMPLGELPSMVYPAYHLLMLLVVIASVIAALLFRVSVVPAAVSGIALILPSFLLSVTTCGKIRRLREIPRLLTLYFLYGMTPPHLS